MKGKRAMTFKELMERLKAAKKQIVGVAALALERTVETARSRRTWVKAWAISPSKMDCCFLSSRSMPWLSGGDRRRSITLASSWRFFASVFSASVASGLRGASNRRYRSTLMALPTRALRLDPIAAWSAPVARRPALGNDALEPELVAKVEQGLAVWRRLYLLEEGRVRLQPVEVAFALC